MTDQKTAPKPRAKGTRTVKPVYVVMNVKDNEGNVLNVTKENVNIVSVHKDAGAVLALLDGGSLPQGTFYKRVALA